EPLGDGGAERTTHLDGRALPSQGQPAADAECSSQEFYRQHGLPPHGAQPREDCFEVWNTAAGGFGSRGAHQEDGAPSAHGAYEHGQQPTPGGVLMRPDNETITQDVPAF